MSIKTDFTPNTREQNTTVFADYLPGGRLFCAKYLENSTLRTLLFALAGEITRVQDKVEELSDELFIRQTVNLIEEWESALGIPDSCFTNTGTIERRRLNVEAKLARMNVNTRADFIGLAALFGITIDIIPGEAVNSQFPFTFPVTFFVSPKEARFTMIVVFEGIPQPTNIFSLVFPVTFADDNEAFLKCIIKKLAPANVHVIFRYNP